MQSKEEVLKLVSEWLDAVCRSPSGDNQLVLQKTHYSRSPGSEEPTGVGILVKAEAVMGSVRLPMSKLVLPSK